jgi:hypothetical protein
MRVLIIGCLLALGCDGDAFVNLQEDGADKPPYDFSISRPAVDAGVPDLAQED